MARWAAIIGDKGVGKSTTAERVAQMLKSVHLPGRTLKVGGFFQRGFTDSLGRKCYDLHRIAAQSTVALARPMNAQSDPQKISVCSFEFNDDGFSAARRWITQDVCDCDVLVLDEVSKLEAMGHGHWKAIETALTARSELIAVLSIRAGQLFYVVEKFGLEDDAVAVLELPCSEQRLEQFIGEVANAITGVSLGGTSFENGER